GPQPARRARAGALLRHDGPVPRRRRDRQPVAGGPDRLPAGLDAVLLNPAAFTGALPPVSFLARPVRPSCPLEPSESADSRPVSLRNRGGSRLHPQPSLSLSFLQKPRAVQQKTLPA